MALLYQFADKETEDENTLAQSDTQHNLDSNLVPTCSQNLCFVQYTAMYYSGFFDPSHIDFFNLKNIKIKHTVNWKWF